jgi:hypothetical protein
MSCVKNQHTSSIADFAPYFFGHQRGVFCVLGFYMDDSADAARKIVFSVAGFIGDSQDWFDLERHWRQALDREDIEYFRTYECVNLEGEFKRKLVDRHGLTTARVIADALLSELKQIVATSRVYGYCLGVLMDDYRKVSAEADGMTVLDPDPYFGAHNQLIGLVCEKVLTFPHREIVAFLYDEHSKAALLQEAWSGFKEKNPTWAQVAGTLAPLDDKVHIPIQVGDLLAHSTTRLFLEAPANPKAALDRLKGWLGGNLMEVAYMDEKYLRALVTHNIQRRQQNLQRMP